MPKSNENDLKNALGASKDRLLNKVGWLVGQEEMVSPQEQFLLPVDLVEFLRPAFEFAGFPLEIQPSVVKNHKLDPFKFYKVRLDDGYIALFFLRNKMLQNPDDFVLAVLDGARLDQEKPRWRGAAACSTSPIRITRTMSTIWSRVPSKATWACSLSSSSTGNSPSVCSVLRSIEDIAFLLEERIGLNKVFSKPAASPSPAGAAAAPVSTPSGKTSPQGTPPAPQPPLAAPPDEEKYLDFDLAISPTGHVVASSKEEGDVPADISTEVPDDIQLALELIDQNKATEKISKR